MQSAIRNPDHDTFLSSSRLLSILNRTFGTLSILSHPVCTGMRTNSAELQGKYLFTHSSVGAPRAREATPSGNKITDGARRL